MKIKQTIVMGGGMVAKRNDWNRHIPPKRWLWGQGYGTSIEDSKKIRETQLTSKTKGTK